MDLQSITFFVQDQEYKLVRIDSETVVFACPEHFQTGFTLTKENYRSVAVDLYIRVYGEVGSYGDLEPYIQILQLFLRSQS